jgi:hypothetical protein
MPKILSDSHGLRGVTPVTAGVQKSRADHGDSPTKLVGLDSGLSRNDVISDHESDTDLGNCYIDRDSVSAQPFSADGADFFLF